MFKNKIIIITGGSSGVGKDLAVRLARLGAHLALIARDEKKLKTAQKEIRDICSQARTIEIFPCDVSDSGAVNKTFSEIADRFGSMDILINSAGILRESYFELQSLDTFHEVININFFGTLHCIKAVLPFFKKQKNGRIVNISSVAGLMGVFGYSAYCASKHAVVGLTASLRAEFRPQNIWFHIVCPPEFSSPMVDEINTYRTPENKVLAQTIPVMTSESVADAIIKGIQKNQYEIIPGIPARALTRMDKIFPAIGRAIVDMRIKMNYRGPDK
jgi:3-dehydrosphinganine reductase